MDAIAREQLISDYRQGQATAVVAYTVAACAGAKPTSPDDFNPYRKPLLRSLGLEQGLSVEGCQTWLELQQSGVLPEWVIGLEDLETIQAVGGD